ncbi:hypothetical protein CQA49_00790 [Helicobacter sp. MIT 00-7814]|uniref:hypothetical protein n=1 Tax=unclassified Helicobacter TaxID=2593540 RepID=UPI000E1E7F16|nr:MULTISPECIES: hypothetical protein [unclassified Helicobacter]RDU51421.1 hypothetical protein CQA37_09730 [Helicobacter sp. MIT 99-10781]RDU56870.1 hypothetical protein CQA49_00790 [Helicobacter sp. MIT 00-7814]
MKATREAMATALTSLGYSITRTWHFAIREERTPSAYINQDGSIHDFGSDFHGDLVTFLQEFHNFCNVGEAINEAKRLLNKPIEIDFSNFERREKKTKSGFIGEKWLVQYKEHRQKNFKAYSELLKGLMPSVASAQKRKEIALKFDIGFNPASAYNGKEFPARLIMPIRNAEGKIITLWKYNPFLKSNDKLRYTQDRPRSSFNLCDLKNFINEPEKLVFVCEGEKDVINATGNGLRAITPGSATSLFKDDELPYFRGLRVVIVGDNDEAGKSFNSALLEQLSPLAKSVRAIEWNTFLRNKGYKGTIKKGFDLSDWLTIAHKK